jgi:ubiquinone/menaquinone biosynthesis C-methylase UbiE
MATEAIRQSEQVKAAYDSQYQDYDGEWRLLGAKQKADNIQRVTRGIPRPQRVLELGAGDGSILRHLIAANFAGRYAAVEISESAVQVMKQHQLPELTDIQVFDGYHLPYEDEAFDLVILSHVLEHVEYPRALLREIKRVSCYQVIEVPCDFSFDVDKKTPYFLSFGHLNIYTPALLRFLLLSEGFVIHADYASLSDPELVRYNAYHSRAWRKSWKSELRFRWQGFWKYLRYQVANANDKELLADAYTVLCEKTEKQLEIFS